MKYILKKDMVIDLMAEDMGYLGKTTEILPLSRIEQNSKWGEGHWFGGTPLVFTKQEAQDMMKRHVEIYGQSRPLVMEEINE